MRKKAPSDLFDHALMAAVVGFFLAVIMVADANAQSYTTFPNLRTGNMDFTATIRANGGACSSGQAVVSGGGSVSCVAVIPASEKGANNGVATLDSGGLVPASQLPFSGLSYEGSWNANTNSPTLADGVGTGGDFYIASVAGTQNLGSGSLTFAVGDWALYNGTIWQKVPSSAAVTSVFGRTGSVVATAGDYTATEVTNTPAGGIAATTVQAAVNELDTEKQAAASTLTSWAALTRASGFDTFTQTPSSANLRGLLTDETGTGLAYFQGGALGTPSSGTLTSATGLPWSTGLTGVPTTAVGYGITGGAKLDAYAGGDTPSAFTLGIVDSTDAAAWRSSIGAGTATITPAALTKADDTNVTLTLGGTPATSLLQAASITAGWTGTLAKSRGGFGESATGLTSTIAELNFWDGSDTPSAFTKGIVDSADAAAWRTAIGAGTSSTTGTVTSISGSGGSTGLTLTGGPITTSGTLTLGGTLADGSLSSNVPLKNAANVFAPASGTGISITPSANLEAIRATNGSAVGVWYQLSTGTSFGSFSNHPVVLFSNSADRVTLSGAGNVTIAAPSSGATLALTGAANAYSQTIVGSGTTSQSYGLSIQAGTNSSDYMFAASNFAGSNALTVLGDRSVVIGTPTGGALGAGTLNTAGDIAINNVSVCREDGTNCDDSINATSVTATTGTFTSATVGGSNVCRADGTNCPSGSGVSSITGTSNQVIASASTGAITLSLPQSINTGASVQFGSFGVGTAASGTTGEIRATNNVTAYYSSDERLKENVTPIRDALAKLDRISGVEFDWTDQYISDHGGEDDYFLRRHDVGVIAQEVQAVLPEVVATREDGTLAVKYDRMVPLLIEAIKELKAANDELYRRVQQLEGGR